MEVLLKTKNRATSNPSVLLLAIYLEKTLIKKKLLKKERKKEMATHPSILAGVSDFL